MVKLMKNLFAGLAVILLIGIGVFIGKEYFQPVLPSSWSDSAIKEVNKHGLVEFRRDWSKTIEDDEGAGKGIIEYQWHFTYLIGIDVPNAWDWNIKRSKGVVTITAPRLSLLNESQFSVDGKVEFNEANGNRQQRMDDKIALIGIRAINDGIKSSLKKDSQVYEHAKLSLESFLLNLFNQANPGNPSSKLTVIFK